MTARLWIPGPLPGMNEILDAAGGSGGRKRGYSSMKKAWTLAVKQHAQAARLPPFARAYFSFRWHERTRKRNPDNIAAAHKFILDGLVAAKVLGNDGWGEIAGWADTFQVSDRPGVEVVISAAE